MRYVILFAILFFGGWIIAFEELGIRALPAYPVTIFALAAFIGLPLFLIVQSFLPSKKKNCE